MFQSFMTLYVAITVPYLLQKYALVFFLNDFLYQTCDVEFFLAILKQWSTVSIKKFCV